MAEDGSRPAGPVRHARFGGVLEGRVVDPEALRRVVSAIQALGLAPVELELEGGRYSLLLDDAFVPGERVTEEALASLVTRLNELVEASGEPATAESTLRCTETYQSTLRETLFYAEGGRIRSLSRVRPLEEEEAQSPRARATELRALGRRKAAVVAALLLVAFGLMAWKSGYVDRLLSHTAEELALDSGAFGTDLRLEVEKSWGNYELHIRRGESYPADAEEIKRRRAEEADLARAAALDILAAGGKLYVQLRDADGDVLEAVDAELRPLLGSADAKVTVELPGRISARTIRLSLERGIRE